MNLHYLRKLLMCNNYKKGKIMKKYSLFGILISLLLNFVLIGSAYSAVLWYNGDYRGYLGGGLANEINTSIAQSNVYEDFQVINDDGWLVNTIWSNDLMSFTGVEQAMWEIRRGVSEGNGGTLIAGGISPATQIATGRGVGSWTPEYTIEVTGLSIYLEPDTYWLTVAPIGFGYGYSYVSGTNGLNAIGAPVNNNYALWSYGDLYFTPLPGGLYAPKNFSMGVEGVIPEPATFSLFGLGLLGLFFKKKKAV
ncbi:MAG: PEP-CTERM sorting domain-containing protein [Candidatus Omnitrophota bacterium]|nr:PEP-CTERM sorting domain-containing protein [Candidatus Omnitrophota bacterium]